jgi:hypothetical protein
MCDIAAHQRDLSTFRDSPGEKCDIAAHQRDLGTFRDSPGEGATSRNTTAT